jgi:hypothetical protein
MIRRFAPALILAVLPLAAQAGDPLSYSFIEGQYLNSSRTSTVNGVEYPKDTTEGYRFGMNISMQKYIYFTGDADKRRGSTYRFGTQSAGLGGHTDSSLSPHLQVFGAATFERWLFNDVTGTIPDKDRKGYGAELGIRAPYENYEFSASYKYMNYGEENQIKYTGDKFGAMVAVQISPYFNLTGTYHRFDENAKATGSQKDQYNEWLVGFRTYFATGIDRWRRRGGLLGGDK